MNTPVLLIIFNRPSTTRRLVDSLRKVRPSTLYVFADGPRASKPGETELCADTRAVINEIDWECDIKKNFQQQNLGCKLGPITATNWLFENEERGIVLEDDCLAHPSFFSFCTEMLERYKDVEDVMHISGNNFQDGVQRGDARSSYYFSKYTHNWGWATWRRAWKTFVPAIEHFGEWDRNKQIRNIPISRQAQNFWEKNFRRTIAQEDSWDSLWMYAVWLNNGLAILPQKNLVSNIGFGQDATHTTQASFLSDIPALELSEIIHPTTIGQDRDADDYTFKKIYYYPLWKKVSSRISRAFSLLNKK